MQHLDEGTLQAWLDRPRSGLDPTEIAEIERHLGSCGLCASRLSALRDSSERARALLSAGREPVRPAPPYERIAERALSSRRRRRAQKRLTTMAWAASVVVALGVGWMTNDLYRAGVGVGGPRYESVPVRTPSGSTAEPAPSPSVEAPRNETGAVSPEAGRAGTVELDRTAPPRPGAPTAGEPPEAAARGASPAAVAPSGPGSDAADAIATAPALEPSPAPVAPPQGASPSAAVQGRPRGEPERADVGAPSAKADQPVVVSGVVVDERGNPVSEAQVFVADEDIGVLTRQDGRYSLALPGAGDSDSTSFDVTVQRIGFGQQTRALSGRGGDTLVADFDLKDEALSLDEVIVTGTPGGTQRRALGNSVQTLSVSPWHAATRASAQEALGRPLRVVPGLGILTIEIDEQGAPDGSPLVRIRQQLGDGLTLTLVEGPSDAGRESWPVEGDGAVESVRAGDLLVTGTAAVSPEALQAMLGALR